MRRIHMFTGLFLGPWMLMYALSTLVMTHDFVASFYSSKNPTMVTERELDYARSFPTNLTREEIAGQILQDIGLAAAGGRIVVLATSSWNWPGLCDVKIGKSHRFSRVFPIQPITSPFFDGIDPQWFVRWNGFPGDGCSQFTRRSNPGVSPQDPLGA